MGYLLSNNLNLFHSDLQTASSISKNIHKANVSWDIYSRTICAGNLFHSDLQTVSSNLKIFTKLMFHGISVNRIFHNNVQESVS